MPLTPEEMEAMKANYEANYVSPPPPEQTASYAPAAPAPAEVASVQPPAQAPPPVPAGPPSPPPPAPAGVPESERERIAPQGQTIGGAPTPEPIQVPDFAQPSGGGGRAGWSPSSRSASIQEGVKLSDETKEDYQAYREHSDKATSYREQALRDEAEKSRAEKEAKAFQATSDFRDLQESKLRHELEMKKAEDDYKSVAEEAKNTKINDGNLWAKKSTGDKILTALSAFGFGFIGKGKDFLGYIQKEIDQDIDVQKANIQNLHTAANAKLTLLGKMREKFGDEDRAIAATKLAKREMLAAELDKRAAGTTDPKVLAEIEEVKAANAKDMAHWGAQLAQLTQNKVTRSEAASYHAAAPRKSPGDLALEAKAKENAYLKLETENRVLKGETPKSGEKLDEDRFVPLGDGKGVYAASKEEAVKLREAEAARQQMIPKMERMLQLRKEWDKEWNPKTRNELATEVERLAEELSTSYTGYKGQGAQSAGDKVITDKALGSGADGLNGFHASLRAMGISGDPKKGIQQAIDSLKADKPAGLKGLPLVREGYARDAKGAVARTGALQGASYEGEKPRVGPDAEAKYKSLQVAGKR